MALFFSNVCRPIDVIILFVKFLIVSPPKTSPLAVPAWVCLSSRAGREWRRVRTTTNGQDHGYCKLGSSCYSWGVFCPPCKNNSQTDCKRYPTRVSTTQLAIRHRHFRACDLLLERCRESVFWQTYQRKISGSSEVS